jgi:large subunit ribosomal protein L18
MSELKKKKLSAKRREQRVRSRLREQGLGLRVSVFRSNQHIYAQLIDDASQKTLTSASSAVIKKTKNVTKTDIAKKVGMSLAKNAQEIGITKAVFDRGSFLYHGRVKALAEGIREGGLVC